MEGLIKNLPFPSSNYAHFNTKALQRQAWLFLRGKASESKRF
jgi:hypothetical protein